MSDIWRHCICPNCGFEWWHIQPSDHIVCPECTEDLTAVFAIAAKAAGGGAVGQCTCHERDGSFTCKYCHSQGFYGHMEQSLKDAAGGGDE